MSTITDGLTDAEKRVAIAKARHAFARQEKALAEWKVDAAEARAEGFRPHYCVHGTNLWTDYDPMCYGCEEHGFNGFPAYSDLLGDAIRYVKERRYALTRYTACVTELRGLHVGIDALMAVTSDFAAAWPVTWED